VRAFKAATTRQMHFLGTYDFRWQRNYYEHVIRNEDELDRVRQYILDNPAKWLEDEENPQNL
jgi:REP element-mobilizing transposase RayT